MAAQYRSHSGDVTLSEMEVSASWEFVAAQALRFPIQLDCQRSHNLLVIPESSETFET